MGASNEVLGGITAIPIVTKSQRASCTNLGSCCLRRIVVCAPHAIDTGGTSTAKGRRRETRMRIEEEGELQHCPSRLCFDIDLGRQHVGYASKAPRTGMGFMLMMTVCVSMRISIDITTHNDRDTTKDDYLLLPAYWNGCSSCDGFRPPFTDGL